MKMRRRPFALLLAAGLALGSALPLMPAMAQTGAQTGAATEAAGLRVRNLGWDFTAFIDRTADLPPDRRVALFKQEVAPLFPAFYGPPADADAETLARLDESLSRHIEKFPAIRAGYETKLREFDAGLTRHLARFRETFPDFALRHEIYLLHSLGQMDGGTRELDGKPYLIFGADVMVMAHKGWTSEAAFFHHELFHVLHEPNLGPCDAVWCSLWTEGLAVYAAARLNPGATEDELLLTFPDRTAAKTRERLAESWAALLPALDSASDADFGELFSTTRAGGDLPLRRGYYLGYLAAQEIGRTRDLHSLARLSAAEAKPLVRQAVEALAKRS